jgi:hypothetical protein
MFRGGTSRACRETSIDDQKGFCFGTFQVDFSKLAPLAARLRRMAHAIHRSLLPVISTFFVAGTAAAAPNALLISETPLCRVSLSKLSYDGPGADDEEFVELVVERFATDSGVPRALGDARPPTPPCNTSHAAGDGSPGVADAAPPEADADARSGALTLGDCGLGELRLVNGGAGACDEYRVIPLGSVIVPSNGFVLLCAQDSLIAGSCNVNTAGRSALRNGFLQNGPADGLRFIGAPGAVALEVAYEGSPSCFSSVAHTAVDETGEISGSPGADDVNVVCGNRFELRSAAQAPINEPIACTPPPAVGAGDPDAAPLPRAMVADSGASTPRPEFAPDVGVGYQGFFLPDASLALPRAPKEPPLEPPSCRASPGSKTCDPRVALVGALAAVLRFRRRRLPRLPSDPRGRCSARCETALRRSP